MAFHEGFLSEIVGKTAVVVGTGGQITIGRVTDLVVTQPHDTFPKIDSLIIKARSGHYLAPSDTLVDIEPNRVSLNAAPTQAPPPEDQALYLVEDLLDKQIVDVEGRKLVRINDIEIARTGGTLRVVAADIGLSGLLRRLGANRLPAQVFDRIPRRMISWNDVAPIDDLSPTDVRLSVSQKQLPRLHPSDLAEIIADLSTNDAARVIRHLDDQAWPEHVFEPSRLSHHGQCGEREGQNQVAADRDHVAVSYGDRDALRHRRGSPGEGRGRRL